MFEKLYQYLTDARSVALHTSVALANAQAAVAGILRILDAIQVELGPQVRHPSQDPSLADRQEDEQRRAFSRNG